jgi:hypothetical protein
VAVSYSSADKTKIPSVMIPLKVEIIFSYAKGGVIKWTLQFIHIMNLLNGSKLTVLQKNSKK